MEMRVKKISERKTINFVAKSIFFWNIFVKNSKKREGKTKKKETEEK